MKAELRMLGRSSVIMKLLLDFESLTDIYTVTTLCWGLGIQCGLERDPPRKIHTVPPLSQMPLLEFPLWLSRLRRQLGSMRMWV